LQLLRREGLLSQQALQKDHHAVIQTLQMANLENKIMLVWCDTTAAS
jgi:hypothetical protein